MIEKFNPSDEKYKKVEDLPVQYQAEFHDVPGGGFIKKEVLENEERFKNEAKERNSNHSLKNTILGSEEVSHIDIAQREAQEENKAREKYDALAPIFICYRDNNNFSEFVPDIVKQLQALGRQVEIHSFPKGTPEDEIKRWYELNKKQMEWHQVISDTTFESIAGLKLGNDEKKTHMKYSLNLDRLMDTSTERAVMGGTIETDLWSKEKTLEECLDGEKTMVTSLLERIKESGKLKKIYILSHRINDHSQYTRRIAEKLAGDEANISNRGEKEKAIKKSMQGQYALFLRECCEAAGIANVEILPSGNISWERIHQISRENGAYIFYDRHLPLNPHDWEEGEFIEAWAKERELGQDEKLDFYALPMVLSEKGLPLPASDLYIQAKKMFHIGGSKEELQPFLENAIQTVFKPKDSSK